MKAHVIAVVLMFWTCFVTGSEPSYQTNRVSAAGFLLIPTSINSQGHVSGWAAPAKRALLLDRQRFDWSQSAGFAFSSPPRKIAYDLSPEWMSKESAILNSGETTKVPMKTNEVGSVVLAVGGGSGFEILTPVIRITQVQFVTIVSVIVPGSITGSVGVEVSEDLTKWTAVGTNSPVRGVVTVSVTNTAIAGKEFYRARIISQP